MDGFEVWVVSTTPVLLLLLLLLLIIITVSVVMRERVGRGRKNGKLPPSPPAWPIMGHLPLMMKLPHQAMAQLATKYGPLMYLRLGSNPALVVSSPDMVRHFLKLLDATFSNRPPSEFHRRACHNRSVLFMKSGPEWRDIRRICSAVLFHPRISDSHETLRMEEVSVMLKAVTAHVDQEQQPNIVNLAITCARFASSTMSRLLFTDARHTKYIDEIIQMGTDLLAIPAFSDFIPWLRCLDWRLKRNLDRFAMQVDLTFEKLLNERRNESNQNSPPDFLDGLLSAQQDDRFPSFIDDRSVIQTCMDIISASTDTTATVMEWAMAELLANPAELKRLEQEIDSVVPSEHPLVLSEDLGSMTYLKAVIKETLRLHPPVAIIMRLSSEVAEIQVGSYSIPPNCALFVNVWAMGRDPAIWGDPHLFRPSRFVNGEITEMQESIVELSGPRHEFIPFGSGRRRCPGVAIAMATLELGLSNFVHAFHWTLPPSLEPAQLDMEERNSFTVSRLNPLLACATPRTRVRH